METLLVVIIVSGVVLWACRGIYRTFTGKTGGCNCANSCRQYDCDKISQKNDK